MNHNFVYKCRCQQFDQLIATLRLLDLASQEDGIVGLNSHKEALKGIDDEAETNDGLETASDSILDDVAATKNGPEEQSNGRPKAASNDKSEAVSIGPSIGQSESASNGRPAVKANGDNLMEASMTLSKQAFTTSHADNGRPVESLAANRDNLMEASITPSKKAMTFLQMYLLEEGKLGFDVANLLRRKENRTFANIADTMTEMFDDDRDAFFAAVCFKKILGKFG